MEQRQQDRMMVSEDGRKDTNLTPHADECPVYTETAAASNSPTPCRESSVWRGRVRMHARAWCGVLSTLQTEPTLSFTSWAGPGLPGDAVYLSRFCVSLRVHVLK